LLYLGDDTLPISGSKWHERLEENAAAADVTLPDEDLRRIEKVAPRGVVVASATPSSRCASSTAEKQHTPPP
jgi:diketogulonate reductase-like aldo/keto reductase